ncbi:MAG: stage II sporulation protein R [Clostridia bacterium]|nr:stage II sporulation protein R [Clostridia bacterium]
MKKLCILFLSLFIIILSAVGVTVSKNGNSTQNPPDCAEYLRIHIRANSNAAEDQAVKYAVRDQVVNVLTPLISDCKTKEKAVSVMQSNLVALTQIARATLEKNGFYYGAQASVRKEVFPTRIYEEYTLEAGEYDALILELGAGAGDNWWCCIYPPLCFTSANQPPVYRSKIAEIIADFYRKREE